MLLPDVEGQRKKYESERAELAHLITRAEVLNDYRHIVIYCRRFTDRFPHEGITRIEGEIRAIFLRKMIAAKDELKHTCPVCGSVMYDQCCPDDSNRAFCASCGKTYTPLGYDSEDNYALTWCGKLWDGGEEPETIVTVRGY
jgi:predicted RNA-binding Zn-ribbon protein involved in translation (DUF1610 family)